MTFSLDARESAVYLDQIAAQPLDAVAEWTMAEMRRTRVHAVVVNSEEQYSIWPEDRDLPAGWRRDGFTGDEDECLAYIDAHWTDMRPLSVREWMRDHEHNVSS
ncbi:MAG TPA: MbtH family NRPS accessory protein [Jatrophihabitans sp.]|uniref:MbtH family protein n=1 Tax=Jatrophihabitans sp. TaxID=1932789 RepID=UPI002EEE7AA9